jgi:TonB family protein
VGHSVLRKLLGAQELGNHPLSVTPSKNGQQTEPVDLLAVLRQNLEDGSQPPAAILHATAEAARILSGADGIALALRTKGVIVCRARSGDPTPELGSPLSVDSGISGECVRSASILVCDDTSDDPRVDPEVCRFMGIRSIAVVPLRGPAGIAGILEAFSTRTRAFGEEQIDSLRGLAELAEAAYQRECGSLTKAASDSSARRRTTLTSDSLPEAAFGPPEQPSYTRRYWLGGIAAVMTILLLFGIWLSGREPSPEAAAKEPTAAPHVVASESPAPTVASVSLPKPKAGIARPERSAQGGTGTSAAGALKNAAQIEPDKTAPAVETAANAAPSAPPASTEPARSAAASASPETTPEPPSVVIASADGAPPLAGLSSATNTLPTLATKVSEGVTRGTLIHRVEPVYPAQAMKAHISGNVTLELTIGEDGAVRNVKQISGSPVLADAASDAVRKWHYTPSLLDNKPVEVQVQVTVIFKLPSDDSK